MALLATLNADKLLVPLFAHHVENTHLDGSKVTPYVFGLGYKLEYTEDEFDKSFTLLVTRDALKNPTVSLTHGISNSTFYKGFTFTLGMELGIAYRKVLVDNSMDIFNEPIGIARDSFVTSYWYEYKSNIPVIFFPAVSIQYDRWSLDMTYTPKLDLYTTHLMAETLFMVGYEF